MPKRNKIKKIFARTGRRRRRRRSRVLEHYDIITTIAAGERLLFQSDCMYKLGDDRLSHMVRWCSVAGVMWPCWHRFDCWENKHFPQRFVDPSSRIKLCIWFLSFLKVAFDESKQNEPQDVAWLSIIETLLLLAPFFPLFSPTSLPSYGTLWEKIMTVLLKSQSPYPAF